VLGPLAGGLIIQHLSWAWIFWVNLPVGLLAMAGFAAFLREEVAAKHAQVDVPGAVLFIVAMASLMLGLTQIGTGHPESTLSAFAVFVVSAALFAWQERRAANPIVAFRLWSFRPIATANIATLLAGMVVIGLTAFLPMYVQGVLNRSPLVAGFTLTVMVLGWPVAATLGARSFNRFGLRAILLCGGALLPLGGIVFVLLRPDSSPLLAGLGSLVVGMGMGLLTTAAIMVVQSSVGWAERGAATASNLFARSLGSTLGATVLGAVLNNSLAAGGSRAIVSPDQLRQLLDRPETLAGTAAVRSALGESLHVTFWAIFVLAAATFLLSTLVPRVSVTGPVAEPAVAG
jgi:MFS family permease